MVKQTKKEFVVVSQGLEGSGPKIRHDAEENYPERKIFCVKSQYFPEHNRQV
jgi:hypothetical protein